MKIERIGRLTIINRTREKLDRKRILEMLKELEANPQTRPFGPTW